MLIQFPTIMKLKSKVISMLVTVALMVLIFIPYIQWPAFITASLYFVYFTLKSHKKGAYLAIALIGILAIFSFLLDNMEFIYYGTTLYFIIIHFAHTLVILKSSTKKINITPLQSLQPTSMSYYMPTVVEMNTRFADEHQRLANSQSIIEDCALNFRCMKHICQDTL